MFFPYFELAASICILLLAFHIWTRHYENIPARFFAFFAFTAFLAAILTYSLRIAFTLEIAREINRLSATLWAFVFSMFAHFVLIFTKKEKLLSKASTYLMLYIPPSILGLLFLFTNQMYLRYEIHNIGIVSQPAPLYSFFILATFSFCLWGIGLLFQYSRSTPQKSEKKQALIIAYGSLIAVSLGGINDQVLPLLFGFRPTIPTVVFDITIMNLFIYIAMRRYSLFAISPALAAKTIIETMPDSLMVTDLEGRVLFLNEEAHKYFHVPKEEIIGKNISSLFVNKDKYEKLYDEVVNKKLEIERFEANLCDPLGECIPSLINANVARGELGDMIGIVYIVRDIRG